MKTSIYQRAYNEALEAKYGAYKSLFYANQRLLIDEAKGAVVRAEETLAKAQQALAELQERIVAARQTEKVLTFEEFKKNLEQKLGLSTASPSLIAAIESIDLPDPQR